jgi:hypothetical protein
VTGMARRRSLLRRAELRGYGCVELLLLGEMGPAGRQSAARFGERGAAMGATGAPGAGRSRTPAATGRAASAAVERGQGAELGRGRLRGQARNGGGGPSRRRK